MKVIREGVDELIDRAPDNERAWAAMETMRVVGGREWKACTT